MRTLRYEAPCECGEATFRRFDDPLDLTYRFQHGENPEHSFRIAERELIESPGPFEAGDPIREWLNAVHARALI